MKELLFDSMYYMMFSKETENVCAMMLYMRNSSNNSDVRANVSNVLIVKCTIQINTFL